MRLRIHDIYLLRQFSRILLYSVLAFTVIYVTVDVFEEIDNFIDHEAKLHHIALYYLYSIPFILTYIIPVSLMLGTVFAMGIMARRNELTALISSGVSLARIAAPVILTSILISCFSAYFNDVIVAKANRHKDDVMRHEIEKQPRGDPEVSENFHYLGEAGFLYLARSFNHVDGMLHGVVVQQFAEHTLLRRIDANRATWRHGEWVFSDGYVRTFDAGGERVEAFTEMHMPEIRETPEDFEAEEVEVENMTFLELKRYAEKVRRTGGRAEKYLVDLWFKLSFPFAGSIFVLIGVAFASGKRKQSIATGFGLTLVVSFMYYALLRVGQTLGHNGVLPPLLAAQLGNVIFLVLGVALMWRANR